MGEKEEKPDASPPTKKPRRSGRLKLENPHKDMWMKDIVVNSSIKGLPIVRLRLIIARRTKYLKHLIVNTIWIN